MSIRKGNTIISGKGIDGFSPTASVTKSGNIATISVTDKNGTTTTQVYDGDAPEVITSSSSTYSITNLTSNKRYKLGELQSLTIGSTQPFDIETVIYFTSGTTATTVSLPSSITNLGDVPTMTETSGVNSGTCTASKNYIIAIENNIAVWKEY